MTTETESKAEAIASIPSEASENLKIDLGKAVIGYGVILAGLAAEIERLVPEYGRYVSPKEAGQAMNEDGILNAMTAGTFKIRTFQEAFAMAGLLSKACAHEMRSKSGLIELLINAIEHGNLGVSFEDKRRMILEGNLQDELKHLQNLKRNRDKFVLVSFEKRPGKILFTIKDQGNGFNWKNYPKRINNGPNGRGILVARSMFERVQYLGKGNEVKVYAKGGDR